MEGQRRELPRDTQQGPGKASESRSIGLSVGDPQMSFYDIHNPYAGDGLSWVTTLSQLLTGQFRRTHSLHGCCWQCPNHIAPERTCEARNGPGPAPSSPLNSLFPLPRQATRPDLTRLQQTGPLRSSHTTQVPTAPPLFLWFPLPGGPFRRLTAAQMAPPSSRPS